MTIPELNVYAEASIEWGKRFFIPLEETKDSEGLASEGERKVKEIKEKVNYLKDEKFESLGFNKVGKIVCNLNSAINFIEKSLISYKEFVKITKEKREVFEEKRRINKEEEIKRIAELKKERQVRDKVKVVVVKEVEEKKIMGNPAFKKGFPNPYMDKK